MLLLKKLSAFFGLNQPKVLGPLGDLESQIQEKIRSMNCADLPTDPAKLLNIIISMLTPIVQNLPDEHWTTLYRKRNQLVFKDDYGDEDNKLRLNNFVLPTYEPTLHCRIHDVVDRLPVQPHDFRHLGDVAAGL